MARQGGPDLSQLLARERRARLAAERLLELKSRELFAANRKLALQARALSQEVSSQREKFETEFSRAEALSGENTQVRQDLQRVSLQADRAERRLWEALETIQDGFAVFNPRDQLIIANKAYLKIFSGKAEIRPGVTYPELVALMAENGIVDLGFEEPGNWRARMVSRWETERIEPVVLKFSDGRYMKMIDRRTPDGDMVKLALEITDTIRYEEQLMEERARAEGANRAKSAFLANMSHEIRTPMNGIVGMAELLSEAELNDDQRLYAETIKGSGEALLAIINDVLDFSKIEADKLTLHTAPFDLERAIHGVLLLLRPGADAKGLDLMFDYDPTLPTRFSGDEGRMRQVLTNLLGNAVKFTLSGHVLIRVDALPGSQVDGMLTLRISVEDTGIGIPEDKLDHIFGEFNQVEMARDRRFEGTGLGLAITHRLVSMMGGDISVWSKPNEGSRFTVNLPLPVVASSSPKTERAPPTIRRALVVDNQQVNRMILERQLSMLGLDVTLARDGTEALGWPVGSHDVILVDYQMQDMDGIALAGVLRRRGETAPVFMLSTAPSSIEKPAREAGVTALLQKPLLRRDLFARLEALGGRLEPLAPEDEPALPAARAPAVPTGEQMKVLAAEDNRTNRLVLKKMLQPLDIDLRFAEDGRAAVTAFEQFRPDLILMDISMPELDGRAATRQIRAREGALGLDPVTICALTAHAMTNDEEDILACGMDRYLTKPVKRDALWSIIAEAAPPGARPIPAEPQP